MRKTLITILTGDIVYGEFDDQGIRFKEFVDFMEGFGIPWAPVYGNHENEATIGVDWQSKQLEDAENCMFVQRTLTGNGNYTVGIWRNDTVERVFFMLDSNGCGGMSAASLANGQKSSEYDSYMRVNTATGEIVADYPDNDGYLPIIGGTVIPLSAETGRLKQPFIYLNKNAGGDYFAKYNDPCVVTKGYNR